MHSLTWTLTALITPFTADNKIDVVALERLIELQISAGVAGIVVVGTTGESPTLTSEEHIQMLRSSVQIARDRIAVVAGTGSNNTVEALHYTQEAKNAGADAVLLVAPYYNRPTQEGLYQHFLTLAEQVDIPQIIYNIPGRTGVNIETSTLMRLANHPRIIGVKEASGNIAQMIEVVAQRPAWFLVWSGDDALTLPLMALGGDGVISVTSNIAPREVDALVQSCLRGDFAQARQHHERLLPLTKQLFTESNPTPVKYALSAMGLCENILRAPLLPLSEGFRTALTQVVLPYIS